MLSRSNRTNLNSQDQSNQGGSSNANLSVSSFSAQNLQLVGAQNLKAKLQSEIEELSQELGRARMIVFNLERQADQCPAQTAATRKLQRGIVGSEELIQQKLTLLELTEQKIVQLSDKMNSDLFNESEASEVSLTSHEVATQQLNTENRPDTVVNFNEQPTGESPIVEEQVDFTHESTEIIENKPAEVGQLQESENEIFPITIVNGNEQPTSESRLVLPQENAEALNCETGTLITQDELEPSIASNNALQSLSHVVDHSRLFDCHVRIGYKFRVTRNNVEFIIQPQLGFGFQERVYLMFNLGFENSNKKILKPQQGLNVEIDAISGVKYAKLEFSLNDTSKNFEFGLRTKNLVFLNPVKMESAISIRTENPEGDWQTPFIQIRPISPNIEKNILKLKTEFNVIPTIKLENLIKNRKTTCLLENKFSTHDNINKVDSGSKSDNGAWQDRKSAKSLGVDTASIPFQERIGIRELHLDSNPNLSWDQFLEKKIGNHRTQAIHTVDPASNYESFSGSRTTLTSLPILAGFVGISIGVLIYFNYKYKISEKFSIFVKNRLRK